jgi:HTH-type transcriptional regulator/antitoxin HigA
MKAILEAPRQFKAVVQEWSPSFTKALHRPQTEKEYEALCEFSYSISEKLEEKPDKDMQALLDIVVLLIEQYQDEHCQFGEATPTSVLKTLMEDHGLVQKDLKDEIGSQGIVSEILNGKRQITLKMAKALAKRFSTSVEVFI